MINTNNILKKITPLYITVFFSILLNICHMDRATPSIHVNMNIVVNSFTFRFNIRFTIMFCSSILCVEMTNMDTVIFMHRALHTTLFV